MSINITEKPEMNVVNVGDEITSDQLAGITNAASPTSANPFATMADVGGGGGGSYLPLSGGTMTGDIIFGTAGQYIGEGNFDTSRGGVNGLSLVCSVGYEFNWQAGWLTTTEQNSTTPRPLYLDSVAGTQLRVWHSADFGTEIRWDGISIAAGGGITFGDGTTQTTATSGTSDQTLSTTDNVRFAQINVGVSGGEYEMNYSNDGVYFLNTGNIQSSIFATGATFNDGTSTAQYTSTGITFPDGSTQTTAPTGGGIPAPSLGTSRNYVVAWSEVDGVYKPTEGDSTQGYLWYSSNGFSASWHTADQILKFRHEFSGGPAYMGIHANGLTFPDGTNQDSAPIYSAGTAINTGAGDYITTVEYPDEVRISISGVLYGMPARVI